MCCLVLSDFVYRSLLRGKRNMSWSGKKWVEKTEVSCLRQQLVNKYIQLWRKWDCLKILFLSCICIFFYKGLITFLPNFTFLDFYLFILIKNNNKKNRKLQLFKMLTFVTENQDDSTKKALTFVVITSQKMNINI